MSRWTIAVDQVPPTRTVWDWILEHTDMRAAMRNVQPSPAALTPVLDVPHRLPIAALQAAYRDCAAEIGELRGFTTANGRQGAYVGFSLTFNPEHIDRLEPLYSTWGTPRNRSGEFFALLRPDEQPLRKNSYWDAHGFNAIHPVIAKHFAALFGHFRLTPIRSRAATIRHEERERITSDEFMWHLDESAFCNLRLNIPLFTAPEYLMEIDSDHRHPSLPASPATSRRGVQWRGHLSVGHCYSWDTQLAHRVYAAGAPTLDRVHLVLGFSPWFDYDAEARAWRSNDFYGRVHPLDMMASGAVFRDGVAA